LLRPRGQRWDKLGTTPRFFCAIMVSCNIAVEVQKCMDNSSMDIDERKIVDEFKRIAFSGEKDSERMRALEWLAARLERKNSEDAVLRKLDEVLAELRK